MRVVLAPDSMGGRLTAREVATHLAAGWREVRPDDELVAVPMSDGGEGLLDAVHRPDDTRVAVEVAGPLGHPADAWVSLRADGTAVVETALACGLGLVPEGDRDPRRATTWGVGQLLDAARAAGATRLLVGLGGSATVDGGAGALSGLGFRLTVADGSGLKVGAADLHRVTGAAPGWAGDWGTTGVELLCDVTTVLADAAATFGPQKGATPEVVDELAAALATWADVAERDLGAPGAREVAGSGAAGGLAFGLAAGLGATCRRGAAVVAELVGLPAALDGADLVVTGEGRLDATSSAGKVVGEVRDRAADADVPVAVVAGAVADGGDEGLDVELAPGAPGDEVVAAVRAAGRRLASQYGSDPVG